MKLEKCVTYPTVIADACDYNLTNYTCDYTDDYECQTKSLGSGSETLPSQYKTKNASNSDICTYAESSACVCEDY